MNQIGKKLSRRTRETIHQIGVALEGLAGQACGMRNVWTRPFFLQYEKDRVGRVQATTY